VCETSENNRSTYEQNKRELFDGMRAYHSSEHQHKRDAINFLKTILTVSVGAQAALLGAVYTPELTVAHVEILALGIVFVTAVALFITCYFTNKKIEADHAVYAVFGEEYERFTKLLEIDRNLTSLSGRITVEGKILDPNKPIGSGEGYKKTMHIITGTGFLIFLFIVVIGAFVALTEPTASEAHANKAHIEQADPAPIKQTHL